MVQRTTLLVVATLAVLVLASLPCTDAQACDPSECYLRCIGDGGSSGRCLGHVCQCRVNLKRSVDHHLNIDEY
uniref:Putative secreted protein n=1 Tax=Amblyomma tuberculatum TaxID=48802 RepID=A0A6M2E0F3_9ACAR